jgi:hypothetical protein
MSIVHLALKEHLFWFSWEVRVGSEVRRGWAFTARRALDALDEAKGELL